ncbi:MAG: multifunctional 2-oxoglutarate metabolism enzyme, partial [Acidimicrobiaceae bacterium]|nr:multifunctional 2-oxoglutarate metabolism enzyme [Acidimicrobiaceae bacterium]
MADSSGTDETGGSNGRSPASGANNGTVGGSGAFGPNAWLVEDMYDRFRADPTSVSDSWREFFTDYKPVTGAPAASAPAAATPAARAATTTAVAAGGGPAAPAAPVSAPAPASAPKTEAPRPDGAATGGETPGTKAADDPAIPLRGAAGRIVVNMEASLSMPTATSVRTVAAKLLEVNRTVINNQLTRTMGGKVSFTHLIGYAVVKGLQAVPAMNAAFVSDADGKGTPGVVRHSHVGLGLAVDVEKRDGRTLFVPCIRDADLLDFRGFVGAYEDLVRKVHTNKITPDDFAGTTVT